MRFTHSNALAAIISYIVVVRSESETTAFDSDSLVPIAMITHYSDTECSTLDVRSDFQGYYRNPDAEPGTAEENYTYFCDPAKLSSYASAFGIHNIDSCYVDNGGNWLRMLHVNGPMPGTRSNHIESYISNRINQPINRLNINYLEVL